MAVEAADVVTTAEEAARLDLPPLIIRENLERYLAEKLPAETTEVELERIGEGHPNTTFLVNRGDPRGVLRRPPRPPLPPSAHDVLREWRLLDAVKDTSIRAPRTLLACDDETVIGAPFYLMEYCVGSVITDGIPKDLDSPAERRRMGLDLVDT